jgi:hypothetical protein
MAMMAYQNLCPKPIDGTHAQTIDDFGHAFECYSNFANWNDRKKANALKSMLVDNAARWLQRQEIEDDIAYENLVQLLKDKYSLTPATTSTV